MVELTVSKSPHYCSPQELAIVFSARDGYVWASWPETDAAVKLGRHEMVAQMMQDFLAQDALGKRLTGNRAACDIRPGAGSPRL